ncbi:restriction endonuclease subunit S [Streptomyces fradiae]|uniref:restriction endonuclease subunit S n=1 Tax=Streptomyces fradiae TaxID=1906 RepID=UPI0035137B57
MSLPNGWSSSPLKHVTTVLNRGSAPDYVDDGSVRAVSQAANQPSGLDWSRTRFHAFSGDPRRLKGYLQSGDVIVNSTGTGTLGRVGQFMGSPDGIPCMADGHVTIARADHRTLHPRFSYYWLVSQPFQEYVYAALVVGATNQIELNRERLGEAPVPLPPLEEQRRIADFLDTETARIDKLVALRLRQRDVIRSRQRAHTERAMGECASGEWTRVKYLLRVRPRYGVLVPVFEDAGIPFIRVNDLLDLEGRASGLAQIPVTLSNQYARTITRRGDVLLSVVGTLGRAAVVPEELVGANIARAVCSIRLRPDVDPSLFVAWIATSEFERQALLATGSDSAQPTLGMEDLSNFAIRWPTDAREQASVAGQVREGQQIHSDLVRRTDRQLALLAERRQALITAAVTGQLDVTTARPAHDRDL